jgi:hypothetical protein
MAHVKLHVSGQGLGEHQRGGALQHAAKQVGGPVASNPRDRQVWMPELTSVSSTVHDGSMARPGMPAMIRPLASRNWLIRRLLRTTDQADDSASYGPSGPNGNDHFRQDSRRPRAARCIEDSRTAVAQLHLELPACAELHRQPAQNRVDEVGVLARFRPGGETPEPSGDRGIQLAGQDPPHLDSAQSPGDRVPWRPGKGRGQGMLRHPRLPVGDRTGLP